MYHGEVNVAHEKLNSFTSVAYNLKVKGLTQNVTSNDIIAGLIVKLCFSFVRQDKKKYLKIIVNLSTCLWTDTTSMNLKSFNLYK